MKYPMARTSRHNTDDIVTWCAWVCIVRSGLSWGWQKELSGRCAYRKVPTGVTATLSDGYDTWYLTPSQLWRWYQDEPKFIKSKAYMYTAQQVLGCKWRLIQKLTELVYYIHLLLWLLSFFKFLLIKYIICCVCCALNFTQTSVTSWILKARQPDRVTSGRIRQNVI